MKRVGPGLAIAASLLVVLTASSYTSAEGEETASADTAVGEGRAGYVARDAEGDVMDLTSGNSVFAFDLYDELRVSSGNIFVSPQSISTALAMTYVGARGRTAEEVASVLRLPGLGATESAAGRSSSEYRSRLAEAFGSLSELQASDASSGGHVLAEANALWGQQGHPFLEPFLRLNRDGFRAGLSLLDFDGDTEGARNTINTWVEEKTLGKIEDLIRPGDLDPLVRIVLTNAIYFKGRWSEQFDPGATRDAAFHRDPGNADMDVDVPMMSRKSEYAFARIEGGGLTIAELPYEGGRASMLVLLPDDVPGGLEALEERLSPGVLNAWVSMLRKREILVALPRFSMTWGTANIIPELEALGMVALFSDGADLSGIDGTQDLYVSRVLHKAFIDVNEEGTAAAAATAVVGRLKAAMPLQFRVDRPFLFLIRDVGSGAILFMGRVTDPTA